jgi:hypothetical protein
MKIRILIFTMLLPTGLLLAQWFDQQSISSTVLLEKWQDTAFVPFGTGFAIHNYSSVRPIIVTCAHLLKRSEIYVTVNADSMLLAYATKTHIDTIVFDKLKWVVDGKKLRTRVSLRIQPRPTYAAQTGLDVGVFLIDLPSRILQNSGDTLKISKILGIPRSQLRMRKDVKLGDELYFVGFPFGIGVETELEPLVRSGSVAWSSEMSDEFLLDAFSFGGNSGSPIFSKIVLGRKPGNLEWDSPHLVGMIIGHIGDSIEGILTQPNPKLPAIIRETRELQNYGLARAIWIDTIVPLIEQADRLDLGE